MLLLNYITFDILVGFILAVIFPVGAVAEADEGKEEGQSPVRNRALFRTGQHHAAAVMGPARARLLATRLRSNRRSLPMPVGRKT